MTHSVACDISQAALSLLPTNPLLHLSFFPATFCWYLSLIPPPLLFCSHSVPGLQLGGPRRAGFPRGNERGHPEGRPAHGFRDPAAGGRLCYRDPLHSSGHPLHRARQSGWEVNATRRLAFVNTYRTESHPGPGRCQRWSLGHVCVCEGERKGEREILNLAQSVLELKAAASELLFCSILWFTHQGISAHRGGRGIHLSSRLKAESHLIWPLLNKPAAAALRGSRGDSFRRGSRRLNWPTASALNSEKRNFYQAIFVSPKMSFNDFNNRAAFTCGVLKFRL